MYKLVVTELAHQDLDSIVSYMPFNWRIQRPRQFFLTRLISVTAIWKPIQWCIPNVTMAGWEKRIITRLL